MKSTNNSLNLIGIIVLSGIITVILTPNVIEAAGGTPYGPYAPHIPEETYGSTSFLTIVATIAYTAGIAVLAYVKLIKNKIESVVGTTI